MGNNWYGNDGLSSKPLIEGMKHAGLGSASGFGYPGHQTNRLFCDGVREGGARAPRGGLRWGPFWGSFGEEANPLESHMGVARNVHLQKRARWDRHRAWGRMGGWAIRCSEKRLPQCHSRQLGTRGHGSAPR
jgi:hypothetical protein